MDNPVLIVEAPILHDESVSNVYEFLQNLMLAFESHYYVQLVRHAHSVNQPSCNDYQSNDTQGDQRSFDDEIPF